MFGLGIGELLVIAMVLFLFVGPKKLPAIGEGLGKSIKNFKQEMKDLRD